MPRYRSFFIVMALAASAVVALSASANNIPSTRDRCVADSYFARSLTPNTPLPADIPAGSELLMRFVNVSDTHIIDDEASTAMNGSWLEALLEPATGNGAAQRLQEEYSDEVLNALENTINTCDAQQDLELMIATGDLTDNMTLNELRRYIDNLDGMSGADPTKKTAFEDSCGYKTHDPLGRPKAGAPACTEEMKEAFSLFTGRHRADAPTNDPDTESPAYQFTPTRSALQIADTYVESQKNGSHHIAPGLPERLRCSYAETDCDNTRLAIPHYAVFGNHDASVRGTLTMQKGFNAGTAGFGRYFLETQREFINEWFNTESVPGPVGHGFDNVDVGRWGNQNDRDDGYYAFDSANGQVRMIVLNTIFDGVRSETHRAGQTGTDTGGHIRGDEGTPAPATSEQGFMDQAQMTWLQGQLAAADSAGKPILVFSHHPDRSFSYGQFGSRAPEELDRLLGSYPNVVAHIAGHTHENIINPCSPDDCQLKGSHLTGINHGFWRIETSSMIDFPQESRIIEVWRLPDGRVTIRSTMIEADQSDEDAEISHRLAIAEAECKTSYMLGGPMSSGPYNQARAQTIMDNLNPGEADIRSKFCYQNLDKSAGDAKDRDVLLLP